MGFKNFSMVHIKLFPRWKTSVVLILVIAVLISKLNLYSSLATACSTVAFRTS